jgi:hypothetical protein
MAVGLSQPEVEGQVPLNPSVASEVTDDGDASDAELGAKLFPNEPPKAAVAMWNRFVTNAKLCLDHYNKENQAGNLIHLSTWLVGYLIIMLPAVTDNNKRSLLSSLTCRPTLCTSIHVIMGSLMLASKITGTTTT